MSRALVLSPHPDDEAIGCGGTLCSHVAAGDDVQVVFLTSGEAGGHGADAQATARTREAEAREAAAILGVGDLEFWREPDGALAPRPELVARVRRLLAEWRPDVVYTTHGLEDHADHRAAAAIAGEAARGLRVKVYQFEIWTPLQRLDHIVDITPWIERKLAAVRAYRTQCEQVAFDQAVAGLNRYRGEMHCWPEGEYAEVFAELAP